MKKKLLGLFIYCLSVVSVTASERKHFPLSVEEIQELHHLQIIEATCKEHYDTSTDECNRTHYGLYLKSIYHRQQLILDPEHKDYHDDQILSCGKLQTKNTKSMTPGWAKLPESKIADNDKPFAEYYKASDTMLDQLDKMEEQMTLRIRAMNQSKSNK